MPTLRARIISKCHDCMGYYLDGVADCGVISCPLYGVVKNQSKQPSSEWESIDPNRCGVHPRREKRILTDEQLAEMRERARKMQEARVKKNDE